MFRDDISRIFEGYFYNQDRRYLASLMAGFCSGGRFFMDNYPFNLLIAFGFLSAVLSKLSLVWKFNRLSSILVFSPIICSPFLLECLSYRFDSPTMLFALVCAITPFLIQKSSLRWFKIEAFIMAILFFYQPFFNLFLTMIGLFSCLVFLDKGRIASLKYYLKHVVAAFLALIFYEITIWLLEKVGLFHPDSWAMEHGRTNFHFSSIFNGFYFHLKDILSVFIGGSGLEYTILTGIILGIMILVIKIAFYSPIKCFDFRDAFWGVFLASFIVFSTVGLLSFLAVYDGSFRFLVGVSGLTICAMFGLVGKNASLCGWRIIPSLLALIVTLSAVDLSFLFGNALRAQEIFTDKTTDHISLALAQMSHGNLLYVRFFGTEGYAPRTQTIFRYHPILEKVSAFYGSYEWDSWDKGYQLMKFDTNQLIKNFNPRSPSQNSEVGDEIRVSCKYDEIAYWPFFNAYRSGDRVVIDFDKKCYS